MSTISLRALISKARSDLHKALENAATRALKHTHHEVDIEHFLLELLDSDPSDLRVCLQQQGISLERVLSELNSALAQHRGGNTRNPVLSQRLVQCLRHAWLHASLEGSKNDFSSRDVLFALLNDSMLRLIVDQQLPTLASIPHQNLRQQASINGDDSITKTVAVDGKTPNLDLYTIDLVERAQRGAIDPVLGRDREIRQMIDVLMRRRQNNPILTGEAGVGKTAIVEGLALRIVANDVPEPLKNVRLLTLDLGLLQAGASVKGEFENRLRGVIDEVHSSPRPIILFIDEAHTMIGAGGAAGQNDAANLLKPALARGELRTIAATTWAEYKKYFEKDAALSRRFQRVAVDEPSEAQAIDMLRAMATTMAKHHGVRIIDSAVADAVRLSSRFMPDRQLPDKAVSVLDTACARVALSRTTTPSLLEDNTRLMESIEREMVALESEKMGSGHHDQRLARLRGQLDELKQDRQQLSVALQRQKQLVEQIDELREKIISDYEGTETVRPKRGRSNQLLYTRLNGYEDELRHLHEICPLIFNCVDSHTVAEVISRWTGIPLGKMLNDEIAAVRELEHTLGQRVIGQESALSTIAERIRIAHASLEDPSRPKGVFLLVGPSGVGKTETALALADTLYGGERNVITINLSEYQEAHTVSALKGSPPGYVGFGEGGVLTEAVRRKPHSVVLLDEVEKAHPDVIELFYQVFDKGYMEDAEGRLIDFRNTVILLTSNVASQKIQMAVEHGVHDRGNDDAISHTPTADELGELIRDDLVRTFKPAFIGRVTVVPYFPLGSDHLRRIVALKLSQMASRAKNNHQAVFTWDDPVVDSIANRCLDVDSGARDADRILTRTILAEVSQSILARMADKLPVRRIHVGINASAELLVEVN